MLQRVQSVGPSSGSTLLDSKRHAQNETCFVAGVHRLEDTVVRLQKPCKDTMLALGLKQV